VPGNRVTPEVPPEDKASCEVVKHIRKLRWIGLDEEADRLQAQLKSCGIAPSDSVIASPSDTD
jgi:hypothetical protein